MNMLVSIPLLASPRVADAARDQAAREGWSLLAMLSILGVLLIFSLLTIVVLRRTRRARAIESRSPPIDPRDPWTESAKRMSDSIIEFDEDLDEESFN